MWKTKHVHWKITNRKAKQILMHAVRHGDKMICRLRELSCHIAGSKSRSPYIYEGLRPVEVFGCQHRQTKINLLFSQFLCTFSFFPFFPLLSPFLPAKFRDRGARASPSCRIHQAGSRRHLGPVWDWSVAGRWEQDTLLEVSKKAVRSVFCPDKR